MGSIETGDNMKTCTFFGHRYTPKRTEVAIRQVLTDLIEKEEVALFLVGYEGSFDRLVLKVLKELEVKFPHIRFAVVFACLAEKERWREKVNTVCPEGLQFVPKRFAVDCRNRWLLKHSDYVVTYVNSTFGVAAKFKEMAVHYGLSVINLAK